MTSKIIDTIGVSYENMEDLIEAQSRIETRLEEYIKRRSIADRYETTILCTKNNRYNLNIDLISESE